MEKPDRTPVYVHCGDCRHTWIVAYTPMEAGKFARVLKSASKHCPMCASTKVSLGRGCSTTPLGDGAIGLAKWLGSGDTGTSSLWMAHVLAGAPEPEHGEGYPYDPADFGRCYRMLRAVPDHLPIDRMKASGPVWAAYVDAWPEMERLWEEESPSGRCPKLYELMQKLQDDAKPAKHSAGAQP